MENLWAPWRIDYIKGPKDDGCVFCDCIRDDSDRKNLILHRGSACIVILNLYPYNPGHLMVAPNRHTNRLGILTREENVEMMELASLSIEALGATMNPAGYNVGINLGAVAGAGIKDHLHMHVVPRWEGDRNFMPVLAETAVIPEHLDKTYSTLQSEFDRLLRHPS